MKFNQGNSLIKRKAIYNLKLDIYIIGEFHRISEGRLLPWRTGKIVEGRLLPWRIGKIVEGRLLPWRIYKSVRSWNGGCCHGESVRLCKAS